MNHKRYLVLPGRIYSTFDGEGHFVSADQLVRLYSVPRRECLICRNLTRSHTYSVQQLIHLLPCTHHDAYVVLGVLFSTLRDEPVLANQLRTSWLGGWLTAVQLNAVTRADDSPRVARALLSVAELRMQRVRKGDYGV